MELEQTPQRFDTVEDYIAWTRARTEPGRTELDDGEVIAMAPETLAHVRTKTRVNAALVRAIETAGVDCEAIGDGIAVRISDLTVYIPDGSVYCGSTKAGDSLFIDNPIIVVEVVSPSSGTRDLVEKMPGYFRVPSLIHYLLIHPVRQFMLHFQRAEKNAPATRIVFDGLIALEPPGIAIDVDEIFPIPLGSEY